MALRILDVYPDEVKQYIKEYNKAVESRDIMEVDLALNGLVTLIFGNDENLREYAIIAIAKIGEIQFKFLKNVIRVLLHRYKGDDVEKSDIASRALGEIVVEKPAGKLIDDKDLLERISIEYKDRLNRSAAEEKEKKEFLDRAKRVQIDLAPVKIVNDVYNMGLYYNKSMLNDKPEEAAHVMRSLIGNLFKWREENPTNFSAGIMLFNLIADENKRPKFFPRVIEYILAFLKKGQEHEKKAAREVILHVYESVQDLLPEELVDWARNESAKRKEQREEEKQKQSERKKYLNAMLIKPDLKWAVDIQSLAKRYNKAVKRDDEKEFRKLVKKLGKAVGDSDELTWTSASKLTGEILKRKPELVQDIARDLLKKYRKPRESEQLYFMAEGLEKHEIAKPAIIERIKEDQEARDQEREKIRKQKEEEYKKRQEKTIQFEGDWEKKLIEFTEELNEYLLKEKMKNAQKLVDEELKPILQAKKMSIRSEAQEIFIRIAEKYPDLLSNIVNEYLELFKSDAEGRFIAVEALGKTYHAGYIENIIPSVTEGLKKHIEADYDERRKEIENQLMAEKISHIKIDVQTIPIKEWPKDIQKICRKYNDAIMDQDTDKVVEQVQEIVDIFMNDRKDERMNAAIEIIGLISKKNIELIAPTINILLQMVDSEKEEQKFKAIKGLGEVCTQRPGWAYMGIQKLADVVIKDPNAKARQKAMLELSRIGKSNATMLIEYVPTIIKVLEDDENKHVRRLAAWTLGNMSEVIPLEAKDAIPALTDALHDEYILVRKFADKALQHIRAAMRKE